MKDRKCIYIPSVDAKDLYLANNFKKELQNSQNSGGYKLFTKSGKINYNKYINSLDFSLDSEKIKNIAKNIYKKNNRFTFMHKGKEFSDKIINVTFKYSIRDFNKIKKNTYVMKGYSYEQLTFKDNIAIEKEQVVGIITDTPIEKKAEVILPDGFEFAESMNGDLIYVCNNIKIALDRKDLRTNLYENGFRCNGNDYVRLKRTSGSARTGKCLFVEKSLYDEIHQWEMCDLNILEGDKVDLAALESYISLPTSSAIDTLIIDPKSILIIPDYDSTFQEDSVIVEMDGNKRITVREGISDISNSIFDGQSLIEESILGEYSQFGMVLLRNRFFKSCCFNTNIQKWFQDRNITSLSQLHKDHITLANDIEDIKLITTPNSIKYAKFAPIKQWLNNIDKIFSIIKHEKKTHFFGGKMVQAHYQLLNTLYLSPEEIKSLVKPSLDYVNLLNTNTDVLKYHTKCSIEDDDRDISNIFKNKNDIVYTMMNCSDEFYKTKYYYDFKKETCKSYLKNIKKGHILIDGNYSVLFGNPYEMLLHSIGKFDGKTSLPPGYIHTTRYQYEKKVLGCRSPHISTSNVLVSTNTKHDLIDTYFNLTDEIVCINSIDENILERLSGADFDSDQMIISDNEILINAALKNYDLFKVPANRVGAKKSQRFYTNKDKADLDYLTSENKIGEIINLSQELNTIMWDTINRSNKELTDCYCDIKDIYHDICILNVLSCIEIDKAKKEFDISSSREINDIKKKWNSTSFDGKTIKPAFLGFIAHNKGYKNPKKKKYIYHKTSMDYLLREVNRYRSKKTDASNFISLSECFKFDKYNPNSVNWKQIKKIVTLCESTASSINTVWSREYYTNQEKYSLTDQIKEDLVYEIANLKINEHTLFLLISYMDMKKYLHISKLLFYVLFNYKNDMLIQIMHDMKPYSSYLIECTDGDVELYGMKFKKYGGFNIE